ncbi:POC1 centriolar protein A [Coelomomyces lativittatus]|nr:POC1 centriolar protein A [Coelomomyces lativittatus]KAJ1516792.1 POC1 centriolar protein A [Coelomomyces lativittatus]KAJ1517736.1 POC1 centriolar protein A [Coelomomyces lativittatus]
MLQRENHHLSSSSNAATATSSDPTLERSFKGHKETVTGLAFKPSMTQLASCSNDCTVMVWNFKPGMRPYRYIGHKAPVTSVDFSPSGNVLASASRDKTVRLWTPTIKGEVSLFTAHTAAVRRVQFSKDGNYLLTCSDDKSIKVWSSARPKFLFTLTGHLNWVRASTFSLDSMLIVSGSDDKTVKVWDVRTQSCIQTYPCQGMCSQVTPVSPLGHLLGAVISDGSMNVWDLRMHQLVQQYPTLHDGFGSMDLHQPWMVSTNGHLGHVQVWDLDGGYLKYTLHGHQTPTTTTVFSKDADYFASAGQDGQIFVWKSNFEGGDPKRAVILPPEVHSTTLKEDHAVNLGPSTFSETKHMHLTTSSSSSSTPALTQSSSTPNDAKDPPFVSSSPLTSKDLPVQLSITLETIVSQLDMLTFTLNLLERRLTLCEDKLSQVQLKEETSNEN